MTSLATRWALKALAVVRADSIAQACQWTTSSRNLVRFSVATSAALVEVLAVVAVVKHSAAVLTFVLP